MIVEIVNPQGKVSYTRPHDHPDVMEALKTPGYSVRGSEAAVADSLQRLVSLPGQPLCKHYTGATAADRMCRCLADIPYDKWVSNMERWPCRRRHILGLEQHHCDKADYGDKLTDSVNAQVDEMAERAVRQANGAGER